jgi:extracellular matrix regulatory protein A
MLVHIGHRNYAMADKILVVLASEGSAVRRLRAEGKKKGCLIDATAGGRTRSVIVATSGQVILSGVQPETLWKRMRAVVGG